MDRYIAFALTLLVACCLAQDTEYYDEESNRRQVYSYDPNSYNPAARDFTQRCMRLAQFSGEKACDVFNICCSEDNVLNKLNGDKCQISDPTNGCTLDMAGARVQWSQCRAFNCTEEITTTTTTTHRPLSSMSPPLICLSSISLLIPVLFLAAQR